MDRKLHHCSGCLRLSVCKRAYWTGSENCDLYVRDCCELCHRCLGFGNECQRTGYVECNFWPRIVGDPVKKMKNKNTAEMKYMQSE